METGAIKTTIDELCIPNGITINSAKFFKGEKVKYKKRTVTIQHFTDHFRYGRYWYVKEMMIAIKENELIKIN